MKIFHNYENINKVQSSNYDIILNNDTCDNCGNFSHDLFKICGQCKKYLNYEKDISNNLINTYKMELELELDYAIITLKLIPEYIYSYMKKFRIIFLLISMAKHGCHECNNILHFMINIGKNEIHEITDDVLLLIIDKITTHEPILIKHKSIYYEKFDIDQIQNILFNYQINRFNVLLNDNNNSNVDNNIKKINEYYENLKPASKYQLELIQVISTNKIPDDDLCILCSQKFDNDSINIILPCGHVYHDNCIRNWFKLKNICPKRKCPVISLKDFIKSTEHV